MKRMSTLTSERRNDLHLTSTGVALARRHSIPLELPPLARPLHSSLPLPSRLSPPLTTSTADKTYQTTAATSYDEKVTSVSPHDQCKKAPGHWKVNYTLDTIQKLESKPWRRSLTMSNQKSEMRAQYCGQQEVISRAVPVNDPQPAILADHFREGTSKDLVPSTSVKKTPGRGREGVALTTSVLGKNQPYITTNNRFHRNFTKEEQLGYARKDVATYWLCEDYPKTWGHGSKVNPLTTPTCRSEQGPMRDRTVFRTGTSIRQIPASLKPLSQGSRTVYNDTYTEFDDEQRRQLFVCPVQSTAHTQGYDTSLVQLVPQMYRTGNMAYYSLSSQPQTAE